MIIIAVGALRAPARPVVLVVATVVFRPVAQGANCRRRPRKTVGILFGIELAGEGEAWRACPSRTPMITKA